MKQLLLLITLFCSVNAMAYGVGSSLDYSHRNDFKKMQVREICKVGDESFGVLMDLEIPMFSPSLQKYLAKTMFDSEVESLPGAVNMFLQAHAIETQDIDKNLPSDVLAYSLSCVSYSAGKYATFHLEHPDIKKLKMVDDESCEIEIVKGSFIYDIVNEKVLTYDDIFSADYIDVHPDSQSINYLFELDDDYLSYGTEDAFVKMPLCQLKDYLRPQFQQLIDWGVVEARAKNLHLQGDDVKKAQASLKKKMNALSKLNEYLSNKDSEKEALYALYLSDKKLDKQIHLYMHHDECWVSGLNKNIMQLTADDMTYLEKKGKQVLPEIEVMKEFLAQRDGQRVADSIYVIDRLESFPSSLMVDSLMQYVERHEAHYGNYASNLNSLRDHVRTHLSLKHDTIYAKVMFIVNKDCSSTCPVIVEGADVEVNKEILGILRKYKKWKPFLVNGKPARVCFSQTFSYVKKTTIVQPEPMYPGSPNYRIRSVSTPVIIKKR